MSTFVDSFWSPGYAEGIDTLFAKLQQGATENGELLALASARADIEEQYGTKLADLPQQFKPKKTGFARDDGASMRTSFTGIVTEMSQEGKFHLQVADNIRSMVVRPFAKWANEHRERVEYSQTTLRKKAKQYERELAEVHKAQKRYFNKCRLLEDYKEDSVSARAETADGEPEVSTPDDSEGALTSEELVLNQKVYNSDEAQTLMGRMLREIRQFSARVPILGTYDHVSKGSDITEWIKANIDAAKTTNDAERVGQDLVHGGFLRLIGQVGSKFANSSVMEYQWRPRAFEFAALSHSSNTLDSITETWSETVSGYFKSQPEGDTAEKLAREVRQLDQKYRKNVSILDNVRCELEELMVNHLQFMERCELDRLKAMKAVMLDFLAALSNSISSIQVTVDKLLLYQESANPLGDLRYIIENYRTGGYIPNVTVYDNYYSSADGNIFGMDLELRCRGDRKHVPYVVSAILSHLDTTYPRLENDEIRLGLWTINVPLKSTHELRKEINTSFQFDRSVLTAYEPPVVANVLKLYLLELPDSLVPSQSYEIFKAIYSASSGMDGSSRLTAILNALSQLRVNNIATLDALTAHIKRLITIANAKEADIERISQELGKTVLRPKSQTPLTFEDTFPAAFFKDLLNDRDQIFKELKQLARQPSREPSSVVRRDSVENRVARITSQLRQTSAQHSTESAGAPAEPEDQAAEGLQEVSLDVSPEQDFVDAQ